MKNKASELLQWVKAAAVIGIGFVCFEALAGTADTAFSTGQTTVDNMSKGNTAKMLTKAGLLTGMAFTAVTKSAMPMGLVLLGVIGWPIVGGVIDNTYTALI